jgi:membrane protein implicated in regulation of membrane protease activity
MDETSATDVADAAGMLLVGLGIVTIQIFPLALPLLVLVIGPLVLLTLPLLLLALPVLGPLWLFRALRRRRRANQHRPGPDALRAQHVVGPRVLGKPGANRGLPVRVHDQ